MQYNPFDTYTSKPPALEGQNKALYDLLLSAGTISFMEARSAGIGNLSNRVSILRSIGVTVHERDIRIGNIQCVEYSLQPLK